MDLPRPSDGPSQVTLTTLLWLCWTKYLVQKPAKPDPGAAQPELQPVSKKNKPTCFRISGIPPLWDSERLKEALRTIDPEFDPMGAELSGPFPDLDSTQTALLHLSECTSYFTFEPKQEKHKIINENGRKIHLVLDKHFYDLTPLNRAEEPIEMELVNPQKGAIQMLTCTYSVIAITGLAGHAFGSWRSRIATERPIDRPMWLCDFLPERFPNARIMTYGYDSSLKEPNIANLTDYRRGFIQCLENYRHNCPVSLCLTATIQHAYRFSVLYRNAPLSLSGTVWGGSWLFR